MAQGLFNLKQVNQAVQQGAWTTGIKPTAVDYLVVAGGGGGGLAGGGAGGLLTGQTPVVNGSAITVTIGAGGSGASGSNSVFGSIVATGGGGSGGNPGNGSSGGSGGGTYFGSANIPGQGTFLQGNAGSQGNINGGSGGGGGGAGTPATKPTIINTGGNGGAGVASAISGTVTTYAGGAGGYGSSYGGLGGTGGGGNGPTAGGNGSAGTANTGGGGGGSTGGGGLSGGSGIVIVSYPDVYAAPTATTGSPTVSTSGSGSNLFVRASGQYLTYANASSQFSFGTGAFTIECWVRLVSMPSGTGYPASYWLFGGGLLNSDTGCEFYINNTQIGFNLTAFSSPTVIGNHGMTTNTWYHVAVVRGGGSNQTLSIYVNGTRVATASSVTATADPCLTGIAVSAGEPSGSTQGNFDGYISNYRIVKGTAVYDPTSSSLTVPTAPLTAIANTQLLLSTMSGAFSADASSNALPATSSSSVSPAWNALSPFTVTGYKNRVYTWTSSGSITF